MNIGNYYRIKTEWTSESENGNLNKTKTEELVFATSYSEVERIAYSLSEKENRTKFSVPSIEIIKTKINELLYNDILTDDPELLEGMIINYFAESDETGAGLYSVKITYIEIDEKSGKEKRSNETIYVPAKSNTQANSYVTAFLKQNDSRFFVVRDIKFDKAEAILWPKDMYQEKVRQFDNLKK